MPPDNLYPILLVPASPLRQKAERVETIDDTLRNQIARMKTTMLDAPGIGLAANQVGILNRVLTIDLRMRDPDPESDPQPIGLINPEIIETSGETYDEYEGCLSIPGQFAEVPRHRYVKVRYIDEEGEEREIEGEDLLAACLQHEIDHLNGVLFVDYLSRLKRDRILKKVRRRVLEGE